MSRKIGKDRLQHRDDTHQVIPFGPRGYASRILGIPIGRREHGQESEGCKPRFERIALWQKIAQDVDTMRIPSLGADAFSRQKRQ